MRGGTQLYLMKLLNKWMQKQHKLFQYHHQTQLPDSSTITRHTTPLILLTDLGIAFSLSSFALSSVTGFPTVRLWWLPTLPSLLAKTQSPIPPTGLGSCLLYLACNILKEDSIA
ncbi:hypothetical protein EK904_007551 [Melospiza melodia maxima]|nr:hypothetical protein EK904_007551 [Melospiza melodia maxima]